MNQRIYLNDSWKFAEEFNETFVGKQMIGEGVSEVSLPHTVKETPFHYFDESIYQMESGYQKVLFGKEEWKGKKVLLTIDGAAHAATVYLNGEEIGQHFCGYTAFTMDISDHLHYGEENLLTVKVDSRETLNVPPFGFVVDYMTYGGIYRDVYLDIHEQVYVQDVFVKASGVPDEDGRFRLEIETKVEGSTQHCVISHILRKWKEEAARELGTISQPEHAFTAEYMVEQVEVWDIKNPALYELVTKIEREGSMVEETITRFGFRTVEFRKDGFYLNNKKTKIRGVNRHQSYPYVGYAMPQSQQEFDAEMVKKELGCNSVRTSHYPQSQYFIDRCDEIGLLVFTEMPGWQYIGDASWKDQAVENVKDMVLQYRNHPSIILWGVRINESVDDDEFYERTNKMARSLDDTRQTGGVRCHKKGTLLEDVFTYNDFSYDGTTAGVENKEKVTSNVEKAYLVSEYNGHMFPTKSFDDEEHRAQHAIRHAVVLDAVAAKEDIAGSFAWCMFDYNTHKDFGSGDRICYHGVMDMFRNPKMAAAVYASLSDEAPVLEISSNMDIGEHPGCNRNDTYIFTNADSVKMYKNDVFIKEYTRADSQFEALSHGPMRIDDYIGDQIAADGRFKPKQAALIKHILNIATTKGISKLPFSVMVAAVKLVLIYHMKPEDAVALYNQYIGDWGGMATVYTFQAIKDGKVVKTVTKEPMTTLSLEVQADHTTLEEIHSYDVAAIRMKAVDEHGNVMNYANHIVKLRVEGPLTLIGPDVIPLRGGMSGTYVKTTGVSGEGKLILTMEGKQQEILFHIKGRDTK